MPLVVSSPASPATAVTQPVEGEEADEPPVAHGMSAAALPSLHKGSQSAHDAYRNGSSKPVLDRVTAVRPVAPSNSSSNPASTSLESRTTADGVEMLCHEQVRRQ